MMRNKFLGLSLATLLGGSAGAVADQPLADPSGFKPPTRVGDIAPTAGGQSMTYVGDLRAAGAAAPLTPVQDDEESWGAEGQALAPFDAPSSSYTSNHGVPHYHAAPRSRLATAAAGDSIWMRSEALLWFPQSRRSPDLVIRSEGNPAVDPFETIFGGEFDSGLAPGFRFDGGRYFANGRFGIGGRVWGLADANDNTRTGSEGEFTLEVPYFATNTGEETGLAIATADVLVPPFTPREGEVDGRSRLRMFGTEAYGRVLFGEGRDFRVDLIGGYTHHAIEDLVSLHTTSTRTDLDQTRTFSDRFDADNRFHGGQIGFETMIHRGRWSMFSLTKVHLGNMNQQVDIRGSSTTSDPAESFENGFLAQGQQGRYSRDVFAFAPEVNVKLAYHLRQNMMLSVGYSFLFWNRVALAGEQIDSRVDPTALFDDNVTPDFPRFTFRDSGFWVQGIDLGLLVTF